MKWRPLFTGLRRASHRLVTLLERLNPSQDGLPVPPAHLRAYYYGTFDFLASVFTHMLPDDVANYVREISRLLAPRGVCVASYFLLNDESRKGVEQGESFMAFPVSHPSGVCRLHDGRVPEAAIAFEESFIRNIHMLAGLKIADVRRGFWWRGTAHDQDLLTVIAE